MRTAFINTLADHCEEFKDRQEIYNSMVANLEFFIKLSFLTFDQTNPNTRKHAPALCNFKDLFEEDYNKATENIIVHRHHEFLRQKHLEQFRINHNF